MVWTLYTLAQLALAWIFIALELSIAIEKFQPQQCINLDSSLIELERSPIQLKSSLIELRNSPIQLENSQIEFESCLIPSFFLIADVLAILESSLIE